MHTIITYGQEKQGSGVVLAWEGTRGRGLPPPREKCSGFGKGKKKVGSGGVHHRRKENGCRRPVFFFFFLSVWVWVCVWAI